MTAIGLMEPGALTDDVVTLAPWVHAEWRWSEILERFEIKLRPWSSPRTVSVYYRADSPLTPTAAEMVAAVKAEACKLAFAARDGK